MSSLIDPIKVTLVTPGLSINGTMASEGIPAVIVSQFLWQRGIVVEKTGLYSFLVLFSLGITKGKWSTLLTELMQFKRYYDNAASVATVLPQLVTDHPEIYGNMSLRQLCDKLHTFYRENQTPQAMNDMYTELPDMVMTPAHAYRKLVAGEIHNIPISELDGHIAGEMIVPYPPGIPLIMPGERYNEKTKPITDYLVIAKKQNLELPGFEVDVHGLTIKGSGEDAVYSVAVLN